MTDTATPLPSVTSSSFEESALIILKRIALLALGSGLIGNAIYIYGLGYYEGFISRLGFDYTLFPIQWSDTRMWAYQGSRELGVSSIEIIVQLPWWALLLLMFAVYMLVLLWMASSNLTKPKKSVEEIRHENAKTNEKVNKAWHSFKNTIPTLIRVKLNNLKNQLFKLKNNIIIKGLIGLFRWFIVTKQSFVAFLASYFFLIFLFMLPFFAAIWAYFPMLGWEHGASIAKRRLTEYEKYLCGSKNDYWSQCFTIKLPSSDKEKKPNIVEGRLMLRNGDYIGLLSKKGSIIHPIVMTLPKPYYFENIKNPCFEMKCDVSKSP